MPTWESTIDKNNESFQRNRAHLLELIESFQSIEQKAIDEAEKSRPKFEKRGRLLPRERIELLLDPGSEFLELMSLAGYQMHDDKDGSNSGGGVIAGIGYVAGIRCMISANNSAIKGGTISPAGLHKSLRLHEIIAQNKLPSITLSESGGANLNYAGEIFVEGARSFANQARLSAAGIPQITVVHGNATAGGAYQPGLSDYIIAVRKQTKMFLAGPPLLKAATGEIADDESLGGAELHAYTAGTAEYLAENDADGIRIAREVMAKIPWNEFLPQRNAKAYKQPRFDAEELLGLVPADPKQPYDCREIIARIADGSDLLDFKYDYDTQTICCWIDLKGHTLGVIGNNGPITTAGATKAAQFIQLCDQKNTPLLFLHNTTGFMVGTESEQNGIIKHGSKMIQAVANTRVAKFSIVVGGSYGAGNYAMCGRGLDPHFIFAWPNNKTAVMGGAQAGKVLRIVTEQKQRSLGLEPDVNVLDMIEQSTTINLEKQSTALYGTAHLWDDGIIDPRQTRNLLGFLLDTHKEAIMRPLHSNSFGVARL
ncbi:acyl-CoA carboxylase subunit beta [Ketobacter sp. MCCC 1A13808]|uniref:acyl-CoA carboxylase subunit beta n=1 Tax=Ketobacter sp. MCCC 1A13808 TaxID=2602738 RepID=UPI000F1858D7|nr:carboxyl transferase domain-containing protein [Ketobacter sp. MCCC 1A13808]MVF14399.1 acyl-CoA carboxylase subunit beta [Ketobacter sp. MCCC 1A13808]RLP52221.1 MAG: acyl-CoA carboxylase subunit beta [Ketobacter sp.]